MCGSEDGGGAACSSQQAELADSHSVSSKPPPRKLSSSDSQFATLLADLESDAQDLEAESWSLAVDQEHVKKLSKETVKRQDVIYGECRRLFILLFPVSSVAPFSSFIQ